MTELLALIAVSTLAGLISVAGIFAVLLGVVAVAALLGQISVAGMLVAAQAFSVLVCGCKKK